MCRDEVVFGRLFEQMYSLCERMGGVIRSLMHVQGKYISVGTLGHQISDTLAGADGIDEDGECEYKSTIGKSINGTYNGISVQPTWEEQVSYLEKEEDWQI